MSLSYEFKHEYIVLKYISDQHFILSGKLIVLIHLYY